MDKCCSCISRKGRGDNYVDLLDSSLNVDMAYSAVKALLQGNNNTVFHGDAITVRLWAQACESTDGCYHLFRAINPGIKFPNMNRAGIVVGNIDSFNVLHDLYKHAFEQYNIINNLPMSRKIDVDANKLVDGDDRTFLTGVKFTARRNLAIFPLVTGANDKDDLMNIYKKVVHVFLTLPEPYRWNKEEFTCYTTMKQTSAAQFNSYCKQHGIKKPTDLYYKAAGCNRWWPHGRGRGYHKVIEKNGNFYSPAWTVDINVREHIKVTYTDPGSSVKRTFHMFYKGLNEIHKQFKRLGYGGFWKEPEFGYISVDPQHFGTMSTVEVRCIVYNLLVDYDIGDVIKVGKELGMVMKHIPNMKRDRCSGATLAVSLDHSEGLSEVEMCQLLLQRLEVFQYVERDAIYQRRRCHRHTILANSSLKVEDFGVNCTSSSSGSRSQSTPTSVSN